jgi:NADPH-dependent curcumin reductase CurA
MSASAINNLPKTFKAMQASDAGQPFKMVEVEMKMPARGEILVKVYVLSFDPPLLWTAKRLSR